MDMNIQDVGSHSSAPRQQTWYLIQCKPRQDGRAEEHLIRQGYKCSRLICLREKNVKGQVQWLTESLFPGYLFINLQDDANWVPLRSTRGVSRVVGFGGRPLPVSESLVVELQDRSEKTLKSTLDVNDKLMAKRSPPSELDTILMTKDGDLRALLLVELVTRQQSYASH